MRKIILLCLALCAASSAYAQQHSAVVANIKSLDGVMADLTMLGQTLDVPLPTQMLPMQLGQLMMSPGMTGIDTAKPLSIFLGRQENPQPGPPRLATRFYVKGDGSEYIDSIKRMLPHHEHETENIHKFPMAGPGADGPAFYVVMKNGQAMAGQSLEDIKELGNDLSEENIALFNSMPGNLSVSFNTDVMREAIAQQMESQKKMLEMQHDAMVEQNMDVNAAFQGNPAEMMSSYNTMVQQLFVQFDQFVLNLDVDSQVTLRTHVKAKPESTLQKVISQSAAVTGPFATLQDPQAIITAYGSLAGIDEIIAPYGQWISELYTSMGPPFDKMAAPYAEMMNAMKGIYSGSYNMIFYPPTKEEIFRAAGTYGISDKASAKAAMDKMMTLMEDLMAKSSTLAKEAANQATPGTFAEGDELPMTMTMEKVAVEAYKGIELEQLNLSYAFATNWPGMTPQMNNIMSNLTYLVGYSDDTMFYSMGGEKIMHDLIDHFQNPTVAAPVRSGFEDVEAPLHGYWSLDVASMIAAFSAFMPQEENSVTAMFKGLEGIHAGMHGASFTEQGGYTSLLRLTKEDLQGFKKIGETMKPSPNGGMPQPTAPHESHDGHAHE